MDYPLFRYSIRLAALVAAIFYGILLLFMGLASFDLTYLEVIRDLGPIVALLGILTLIPLGYLWVGMILDWLVRDFSRGSERVFWGMILILANVAGGIIYYLYLFERTERSLRRPSPARSSSGVTQTRVVLTSLLEGVIVTGIGFWVFLMSDRLFLRFGTTPPAQQTMRAILLGWAAAVCYLVYTMFIQLGGLGHWIMGVTIQQKTMTGESQGTEPKTQYLVVRSARLAPLPWRLLILGLLMVIFGMLWVWAFYPHRVGEWVRWGVQFFSPG